MSQENIEVVRRMYDAFHAGKGDALSYFDPNVVIDASHRVDGRVGRGHEELVEILGEWMGTWDKWREEVEEIRDAGDQVLVISTQHGRGKGSGIEWKNRFWMLYEIQDDKISRWTVYDDPNEALVAAGLRE
ncbi:MAG: nuclear transport factor 2 family protein [Actinomycetota bacterium]|nr:nuclear transport factor 2 family protein [Actinomycetota bacterium]